LADLRKKDESYARREQKYQEEIAKMRETLSTLVLPQQKDDRILTKIEIMHEQVLTQIDRLDDAGMSRVTKALASTPRACKLTLSLATYKGAGLNTESLQTYSKSRNLQRRWPQHRELANLL
jgi:hypothetical protein